MAIIETCSRGGGNAALLEGRVHELADELGDQIEFRETLEWAQIRYWQAPEPTLLITIIGWVVAPIITALVEKLFEKKEDTKNVTIQIIHQDFGVIFNLPADSQKCVDHFKRLEENSEPPLFRGRVRGERCVR